MAKRQQIQELAKRIVVLELEIEKMQREVLEYLTRHVSQPPPAEVA